MRNVTSIQNVSEPKRRTKFLKKGGKGERIGSNLFWVQMRVVKCEKEKRTGGMVTNLGNHTASSRGVLVASSTCVDQFLNLGL